MRIYGCDFILFRKTRKNRKSINAKIPKFCVCVFIRKFVPNTFIPKRLTINCPWNDIRYTSVKAFIVIYFCRLSFGKIIVFNLHKRRLFRAQRAKESSFKPVQIDFSIYSYEYRRSIYTREFHGV